MSGLVCAALSLLLATSNAASTAPCAARPLALARPSSVGMSPEILREAELLFVEAVEEQKVLGYQLLVARRGHVVLHSAGGKRDVANDLPMTTESLLNLASMNKPIAAVALLRMVDDGLLSLDDRVSNHLAGFDNPRSESVTIRQLLLHNAGFQRFEVFHEGLTPHSDDEPQAPSLAVEARELGEHGPDVEPGTVFRYSNTGYNVVGAIIEKISGKKIDDYLKQEIFLPLGMHDTFHDTDVTDSDRMSRQYWFRDGAWEDITASSPGLARASGGLVSTAWDYAKFCQVLLDGGSHPSGRLLRRETLELATSPLIEVSEAYLSEEVEAELGLQSEWYEYRDRRALDLDRHRGLGFVVSDTGVLSHGGVYGTFFYVDPARELVGVILTQSIYGGNPGQAFIETVNRAIVD